VASEQLSRIKADLELFKGELEEERYRNWAGLKEDMHMAEIYDRYSNLFTTEAINAVNEGLESEPSPDDGRCLKYLRTFTTMGYVENAVKDLSDKAATFEGKTTVHLGDENIPYRTIPVLIMNEKNGQRRKDLFDACLVETEKLNEVLLERMTTMQNTSVSLGFKNYRDMCSRLKSIDYLSLESMMEEMLNRTERLYVETMDGFLRDKIGLALSEAWTYDVSHALRADEFDGLFPKDKMVGAFYSTLKGLGIDPGTYSNIQIDMEDRPGKDPRAFCSVINVPGNIKLVLRPTGGYDDYGSLFHEGGHSWHFGNTRAEYPAEYRYPGGDNSVTESFAFLFEYLLSNRQWLTKVHRMRAPDEYLKFAYLTKLMFTRRDAGKLAYELKLHNGKVSNEFRPIYKSCLQRAIKFRPSEKQFLVDVDDAFYCAEYLRASILEAQLRSALEEEFGEEWFSEEKAGRYLKELWSYGQKYTAEELVKTIGYVDLDIEPLILEIERGLAE
jgi:hypothetical protein